MLGATSNEQQERRACCLPLGSQNRTRSGSQRATWLFKPDTQQGTLMARICEVTGKKPMVGHKVSHSNIKTKRRFLPNLQSRRFWVQSENRWVRLRVSGAGLRIIDRDGIDVVLGRIRGRGTQA